MKQKVAIVSSSTLEESFAETSGRPLIEKMHRRTSSVRSLISLSDRIQLNTSTNSLFLNKEKRRSNKSSMSQIINGLQYGDILFRCTSFD